LGAIRSVHRCNQCNGAGKIPEKVCGSCQGQGRVRSTQEVEIKIPAGIEDGTTLRMKGKGSAGEKGGAHGDLFLNIHVRPHPRFARKGSMIYSSEEIPFLIAVMGGNIKVETVHGKVELKIPAGTQSGTEFTLKGKGAASMRKQGIGDHLVTVHLKTPQKLSKRAKELYSELAEEAGLDVQKGGSSFF
jgi:molecular chaperone DnaJ